MNLEANLRLDPVLRTNVFKGAGRLAPHAPIYSGERSSVHKGPAQRPLLPGRDYPRTYRELVRPQDLGG